MGVIKKTALMVSASLLLLVGLGIADPGNSRLMSSFLAKDPLPGVLPPGAFDERALLRTIADFNSGVSAAYLALDPALLLAAPMTDSVKRGFAAEIAFLKQDGRRLEMTVRDIRLEQVRRLADLKFSVLTVEDVTVRYLEAARGLEIVSYPGSEYQMSYTLDESPSGWRIAAVETIAAAKRDE